MLTSSSNKRDSEGPAVRKKNKYKKIHNRGRTLIAQYLEEWQFPVQSSDIDKQLRKDAHLRVSRRLICQYLRDELKRSYKTIKPISFRHNLKPSKMQRQIAAYHYIKLLYEGKTIINVDESIINQTDQRSKGWVPKGQPKWIDHSQRLNKVNITAATDSKEGFYFTINKGSNNSLTFISVLLKLCSHLSSRSSTWRSDYVIMLDNARYHRSKVVMEFFQSLRILSCFLGLTSSAWPWWSSSMATSKTEIST